MQAYILINCNTGSETTVIAELKVLPEIVEINGVWGRHDIFIKIRTSDPNGVEQIIKRLRNHPDVAETFTMHVLYGQGGSIDEER